MQNLSTIHRGDIRDTNKIFIPAGKGKTSFIDVRDIAATAVKVMTEPGHENKAYALTGNKALDYYQVAEIFTHVLGRQIVYTNPSIFKFALLDVEQKVSDRIYCRDDWNLYHSPFRAGCKSYRRCRTPLAKSTYWYGRVCAGQSEQLDISRLVPKHGLR